jgi:hypothetical protein
LSIESVKIPTSDRLNKPGVWAWITRRYTRLGLWSLFVICAFPQHVWAFVLALRDVSWVAERTNAWDAVGVVSYGLVFALVESLILFGVMVLLGYLVSGSWDADRRVSLLAVLVLIASLWAMLEQLYFLIGTGQPHWLLHLLIASGHPLRYFFALVVAVVVLSVVVPAFLVIRSQRAAQAIWGLIDRLSVLMVFYLLFDAVGIIIVLVRNL